MDVDGKNQVRVTKNLGEDRHVTWSPDGSYLMFTSSKPNSWAERIIVLKLDDGKMKKLRIDRTKIDAEIDAEAIVLDGTSENSKLGNVNINKASDFLREAFWSFIPEKLVRKTYPEAFFGTERFPDWKS